jgi:hypothetical protein
MKEVPKNYQNQALQELKYNDVIKNLSSTSS